MPCISFSTIAHALDNGCFRTLLTVMMYDNGLARLCFNHIAAKLEYEESFKQTALVTQIRQVLTKVTFSVANDPKIESRNSQIFG